MAGIAENYPLVRVRSNAELTADDQAKKAAARASEEAQNQSHVTELAAYFRREWQRARDGKQPIEQEMLKSMRQREGVYAPEKLQAIRTMGGSEIKMMLTDVKCRSAESVLHDILFASGERPFSCESTPLPEMPEEVVKAIEAESYQELQAVQGFMPSPKELRERIESYKDMVRVEAKKVADKRAKRMEDAIDDEYLKGGWYEAMEGVISDLVTLKAGILMGPEINMKKTLKWVQAGDPMKPNAARPVVELTAQRRYAAVSPFDVYTTPEARSFQEGTLVHRRRMQPSSLYEMIGVPGFDEKAIRKAIDQYGVTGFSNWLWGDTERARLENRPHEQLHGSGNLIDVLSCYGKVQGKWLKDWGMNGISDLEKYYEANCWLIGNYVIRASLNDDPLGERPFYGDSYVRVRNSPWGRGVPELISDLQDMCDSAARAIANNMGIASGPMVEIEVDRLADGEKVTALYPWKIVQTVQRKGTGTSTPAVRFFQPNSNADVLMSVFEFFSTLADEHSGIPRYQYGDANVGGAARTSSGLSMLMNASSRLFKLTVRNLDHVVIGCTKRTHRDLMQFDDKLTEKCDIDVIAKASQALIHREAQQMRLNEVLANTNNPIDFQLMGPKGRLELLRANLRGLDTVDVDKVLPTNDQLLMQAFAAPMQPEAAGQGQPPEGIPE